MKRHRKVKYSDDSLKLEVSFSIDTRPGHFVTDEVNSMANLLCDEMMKTLNSTRYIYAPLSQIKVQ